MVDIERVEDPAPDEIASGLSAYDSWARLLDGRLPATQRAGTPLQPALIRILPDADREGLIQLARLLSDGEIRADGWELIRFSAFFAAQDIPFQGAKGAAPDVPDAAQPRAGGDLSAQPVFSVSWPLKRDAEIADIFARVFVIEERARPIMESPRRSASALPPPADADTTDTYPVVAVIDDGIGFLNGRFRRDGGTRTRFHAVWLQAFQDVPTPPFSPHYTISGEMLYRPDIDAIFAARGKTLDETAVYRLIDRDLVLPDQHRSLDFSFTHGTGITDVAAGAFPGAGDDAEAWPLIGVQLPPEAVDNTAGWQLEPWIVSGVRWILAEMARTYPTRAVVINISFATFAGPKDGTKMIEARIAALVAAWNAARPRRAVVVYSFGNSRMQQQRAMFRLTHDWKKVGWQIKPDNRETAHAEIRVSLPADMARLAVRLQPPDGVPITLAPIPPGAGWLLIGPGGALIGRFRHVPAQLVLPGVVTPAYYLLSMSPTHPSVALLSRGHFGLWHIHLSATTGRPIEARIEVQSGGTPHGYPVQGLQTHLDDPATHDWEIARQNYSLSAAPGPITRHGTHSSFVTAPSRGTVRVAAGSGLPTDPFRPSVYSAEGAMPIAVAPHLSGAADTGPGLPGTVASGTISGAGRTLSGTSVAAAQATRCIATGLMTAAAPLPTQAAFDAWIALLVATGGQVGQAVYLPRQGVGTLDRPSGGRQRR